MIEIERKFLVKKNHDLSFRSQFIDIKQWYISFDPVVRVRIADEDAYLTIKGKGTISKLEIEHAIPLREAKALMQLKKGAVISKRRFLYEYKKHLWEIDVFSGANQGLIVAEIELKRKNEKFAKPDFVGKEISYDSSYSNASLARKPWKS